MIRELVYGRPNSNTRYRIFYGQCRNMRCS
uniref:Uncharacterized protein n=1 Tax=Siphoviridae sp. ctOkv13 TaxID=2826314 RepID=A0A8S5M382_9CAUD|nr:MAG TPA: hypothetical protein [Siphoviridae sp. ctOkv13]